MKYICKTLLTSIKMLTGKRVTFKPGEEIDEKYIAKSNIEKYLKSGLLTEVKRGSSGGSNRNTQRPQITKDDDNKTEEDNK